ncbi:YbaK/EbsC family protein [Campylobacter curvus]|uniref:YbaK/EbsC family protein n=1 Tax=Campylobacter curvus TaxID=200 RepID=UPI00147032FB|nr:YbaK/EbsC family protein [Campylobacter curvus]
MSQRIFESIKELLSSQNAKFKVVSHTEARTSEEVARLRNTELGQGAKALVCSIKGLNLDALGDIACSAPSHLQLADDKPRMKANKIFVLAVLPADHKANLDALTAALGGTKASLASPSEVLELTDCVFGSVPPFSFHKNLLLIADPSLFERYEEIAFNAGLLDHSIILNAKDYEKIVRPKLVKFAMIDQEM